MDETTTAPERGAWFDDARFGMFIHWGPWSARGFEPSWPLVGGVSAFPDGQSTTVEDYYRDHMAWNPPAGGPATWAKAAKAAGMGYAVLTTKHHDGYTLFPDDTPGTFGVSQGATSGRDLVAEYVDACRAEGLRVGLYLSLPDWHHPDYPAWADTDQPYQFNLRRGSNEQWARWRGVFLAQLEHLLSAYGQIDLLWFDGGWERSAKEWGSAEIEALIYRCQPEIIVNERLTGMAGYSSPEQALPAGTDPATAGRWETCMTMHHSWGPVEAGRRKSSLELLWTLAETVGLGGNLLLNLSPDGDGGILDWQGARLEDLAAWWSRGGHVDAIRGAGPSGLERSQWDGPTTSAGEQRTFLFCPSRPQGVTVLRGVRAARIERITALGSGVEIPFEPRLAALDRILNNADPLCDVIIEPSEDALDPTMTVLELHTTRRLA